MNKICIFIFVLSNYVAVISQENPNILLIIADDMGVDVTPGYGIGTNLPLTPNLDELRQSGLTFTNVWATPVCASTRATIMTGKYGVNNGVPSVPGILSTDHTSIFKQLKQQTNNAYATCLVGKWHLGKTRDYDHPNEHGADEFMGVMESGVSDYYKWNKVENQMADTCYEYATSYFTNYAVNWIREQNNPWMMWLAHVSPHSPYHWPPEGTFTKGKEGTKTMKQYLSMIENLDYEIGRLLDSIPNDVLENTIIIFVGDNGTPDNLVQVYTEGKGTLYQGGIHVPMIISGKGVNRINETEDAHINVCDLYATIAHFSNPAINETGGLYNSLSFKHLLCGTEGYTRKHNYMELGKKEGFPNDAYTIRDMRYKMIQYIDSIQEFYDLTDDPLETNNLLLGMLTSTQQEALSALEIEAKAIRTGWSCNDGIKNGQETGIDCGGACGSCDANTVNEIDYGCKTTFYPNPFDKYLTIDFNGNIPESNVQVFNSIGQKIQGFSVSGKNNITISTGNYASGVYYILIHTGKASKTYKLIKH